MGTAIGQVIDRLVTGLPAPLAAIDPEVQVVDNEPGINSRSLVAVGRTGAQIGSAADGSDDYLVLGAYRLEEAWTLDLYVQCYRNGTQKVARDAAIALYDGILHFLQADLTLGGALQQGRYAHVGRVHLAQTQDDADTGASGAQRMALISLQLVVPNSYIP